MIEGTSVMLTPPSTTNHQHNEQEQSIMSQIDELKQLFKKHQQIIREKSASLESITEQLNDVQERGDFDGTLDDIRNNLNGLLSAFQGKLANTSPEQIQTEERENGLDEAYSSLAGMENENRAEAPHETISQLQGYLHSDGHNLGILSHCFNDVLDSANGLISSIPMDKNNARHINELLSLIEGCIGSFAL